MAVAVDVVDLGCADVATVGVDVEDVGVDVVDLGCVDVVAVCVDVVDVGPVDVCLL